MSIFKKLIFRMKPTISTTLTAFNISSGGVEACTYAGSSLSLDLPAYHDGVGVNPQVGDYIYEDISGTIPLYTGVSTDRFINTTIVGNTTTYIQTTSDGLRVPLMCR